MSQPPDLADVLAALAAVLRAQGIAWYVFGAQAVAVYGIPRLTADVDATVGLPPEKAEQLAATLPENGFVPRVSDVPGFVRDTRVLPMTHSASGMPLDLVLAGPGLEEDFLSRARLAKVGDVDIPFISPEDLVATKVLAGDP